VDFDFAFPRDHGVAVIPDFEWNRIIWGNGFYYWQKIVEMVIWVLQGVGPLAIRVGVAAII
jgi:hypothetical protein